MCSARENDPVHHRWWLCCSKLKLSIVICGDSVVESRGFDSNCSALVTYGSFKLTNNPWITTISGSLALLGTPQSQSNFLPWWSASEDGVLGTSFCPVWRSPPRHDLDDEYSAVSQYHVLRTTYRCRSQFEKKKDHSSTNFYSFLYDPLLESPCISPLFCCLW